MFQEVHKEIVKLIHMNREVEETGSLYMMNLFTDKQKLNQTCLTRENKPLEEAQTCCVTPE